ncbi:Fungal specific transcription factor domain-containing protein 33 [Elsinoe fawcettii]|nr:Fungal specific transcription factor domain-containing protein 33 [Elsinoe fawcettii]
MVLDLGLQRDLSGSGALSLFKKEMGNRLFWCVYSLDRRLSTMMGRPIGLRDEACDLRLPADIDDKLLLNAQNTSNPEPTHMSFAIHLFKLSRLNSEMKYILHSVQRNTPSYALPAVLDIQTWQQEMVQRLDDWKDTIPSTSQTCFIYVQTLCQIQYHTTKTFLLLPSPGIPRPTPEARRTYYQSSLDAIRLFNKLYLKNLLMYDWSTCHSMILSTFCVIHSVMSIPNLAQEVVLTDLMADLRAASNILSAIGEHWSGAKRSRDLLEELGSRAIRLVIDQRVIVPGSNPPLRESATTTHDSNVVQGTDWLPDQQVSGTVHEREQRNDILPSDFGNFSPLLFDSNNLSLDYLDFISNDFDISYLFRE